MTFLFIALLLPLSRLDKELSPRFAAAVDPIEVVMDDPNEMDLCALTFKRPLRGTLTLPLTLLGGRWNELMGAEAAGPSYSFWLCWFANRNTNFMLILGCPCELSYVHVTVYYDTLRAMDSTALVLGT
jgi:hypothetical protein